MADNVQFQAAQPATPSADTVVAADVIGGVAYQRVKVVYGDDGSATDVSATNPLPVVGTLTVDNGGTFAVQATQAGTWNIGTVTTVTAVTDITNVVSVDDNGSTLSVDDGGGTLTVDGTVAATQSGTWNVTNISGTVSLPTGASTAANQTAVQGTTGSAVPSKGLLVQGSDGTNARNLSTTTGGVLKVDLSGTAANATAVKVDGSAVTQPVSGTVTANAGTGSFTVAQSTATNLKAQVVGTGTFAVQASAATSGGATAYKLVSAASTNATSVKGSAGQVYMITASNVNASARYLKLYNKATAPTVGTDTPVHTFLIPGGTTGAGTNIPVPACGIAFGTGIAFAITTGVADSDTGAVAASDIVVNLAYI